jgi:hypothetical protein
MSDTPDSHLLTQSKHSYRTVKTTESSKSVGDTSGLERERDQWRECLLRDIHDLEDQRDFAMSEMERRGRERDKARDWVFRLRKQRAIARNFGEQMERERDEAREDAKRATYDAAQETIKVSTVKSHWIEACRERDHWKSESLEQAKLLAMSADREEKLRSQIAALKSQISNLKSP